MIEYRIPINGVKESTNKIYAGIHWAKRKQLKDSILGYARFFCRPIERVQSYPVEIRYRFIFESRPLDTLNCAYVAKCFEDAFRTLEILKDDAPQYVARSILEVVVVPKSKGAEGSRKLGKKERSKTEDWLEITIEKFNE